MLQRELTISLILIVCGSILPHYGAAQTEGDAMLKQHFAEAVLVVRSGKTSTDRTHAAEHLFDLTRSEAAKQMDDQSIAELADLLDVTDDSVRYWVARSLGNFGPRARSATPKLQIILAKVDCINGSKTSASGIRLALKQLGVRPPSSKCG